MQSALRRAVVASLILAAVSLLLSDGIVGTTFADFNGETSNVSSAFAGGWVGAPSGATTSVSGYDVSLGWTAGAHGPVTGQSLYGVDNLLSSDCTGAAYDPTPISTTLGAAGTSYTDSNRANATNNGDWFCYQLVSTSATVWNAPLALAAVQIGLVTTAVAMTNGGTANRIDGGDTIKLTFNQQTNLGTGPVKICIFASSQTMLIGDQKNGASCGSTADGYSIAQLTTGATLSADARFTNASVSLSASAPWTATISIPSGATVTTGASPTWTATPSASILSSAVTDQATMCTAAKTTCQPTTSTNF